MTVEETKNLKLEMTRDLYPGENIAIRICSTYLVKIFL